MPGKDPNPMVKGSKQIGKAPKPIIKVHIPRSTPRKPRKKAQGAPQIVGAGTPMLDEEEKNGLVVDVVTDPKPLVMLSGRPDFNTAAKNIELDDCEHRRHIIGWADTLRPRCGKIFTGAFWAHRNTPNFDIFEKLEKLYAEHKLKRTPSAKAGKNLSVEDNVKRHAKFVATQLNSVVNNLNPGSGFQNTGADILRRYFRTTSDRIMEEVRKSITFTEDMPDDINRAYEDTKGILRERFRNFDDNHDPTLTNLNPGNVQPMQKLADISDARAEAIDKLDDDPSDLGAFVDRGKDILATEFNVLIKERPDLDKSAKIFEIIRILSDGEVSAATDISPVESSPDQTKFAIGFKKLMDDTDDHRVIEMAPGEWLDNLFSFFGMPPLGPST